jgi:hypothetical protein
MLNHILDKALVGFFDRKRGRQRKYYIEADSKASVVIHSHLNTKVQW